MNETLLGMVDSALKDYAAARLDIVAAAGNDCHVLSVGRKMTVGEEVLMHWACLQALALAMVKECGPVMSAEQKGLVN